MRSSDYLGKMAATLFVAAATYRMKPLTRARAPAGASRPADRRVRQVGTTVTPSTAACVCLGWQNAETKCLEDARAPGGYTFSRVTF